jgi:hypothetical protein
VGGGGVLVVAVGIVGEVAVRDLGLILLVGLDGVLQEASLVPFLPSSLPPLRSSLGVVVVVDGRWRHRPGAHAL